MAYNYSYWEKTSFFDYDVIIAGGGIVGLNAAIRIKEKQPSLSVVVLDSGFLPSGASTKNAGFACFGSVSELIEQEKICGTSELVDLIDRRWRGLNRLKKLTGVRAIDFQNNGGFEVFTANEDTSYVSCVDKIKHFNKIVHSVTGTDSAFSIADREIKKFGFHGVNGLLKNKLESQIDAGKMMRALIGKAMKMGVSMFNSCLIHDFKSEGLNHAVFTSGGNFTCKKLIICTNAFTKLLLPEIALFPGRGQVIVTNEINNLRIKGAFHFQKGYYYFRNINNRLLLGGGRNLSLKTEETTEFGTTNLIQDALRKLIETVIMPNTPYKIDLVWSGIMAFGSDLNPIIKEVSPNIFCSVRSNGMGVAMGSLNGSDVADLALNNI